MLSSALVALALSAAASAAPSLSLTLGGANSFAGVSSAVVSATLTNTGDETLKLLNHPNTILSKWPTDTFAISLNDGKSPRFQGVRVKYVATPQSSVTVLEPGQSITVDHSLADAYDFSNTGEGAYSIDTSSRFYIVTDDGIDTIYANTLAHEARLSGELKKEVSLPAKRATYNGCTSARQSTLVTAQANAQAFVTESLAYLRNHTSSTARYTTWFGTYTAARHSTVESHYAALDSRSYASYTYDCTCTDSDVYAYTYSYATGQIWLCGVFWRAGATGTDSQAGTLVHESTHWSATAGTGDYAYGQTRAKALAQSDPATAIRNADSHEYFSENTPALA